MRDSYRWYSSSGSDTSDNWDYCGITEGIHSNLIIVADGTTSSPNGGELAKTLICSLMAKFQKTTNPPTKTNILRWLKEIHKEIRLTYFADSASYLVAIPNPEGQLIIFHAGDCLLGRVIKDTKIQWLIEPHTLVNATKSVPHDDLAHDPDRNILTRSFRGWKFIEPEFNCIFTTPAEKIIIASDGFWADLSRQDQLALITESSEPIDPRDDISFLLFSNNLNEKNIPFLPKTPHPHSQTILRIR